MDAPIATRNSSGDIVIGSYSLKSRLLPSLEFTLAKNQGYMVIDLVGLIKDLFGANNRSVRIYLFRS